MPEGYYLYRHSLKAELDGKPLALPLPEGERHQDDFLGEQEIYRNTLRFSLPDVQGKALTLHLQGCAEGLICYPPIQRQFHFEAGNSAGVSPPRLPLLRKHPPRRQLSPAAMRLPPSCRS